MTDFIWILFRTVGSGWWQQKERDEENSQRERAVDLETCSEAVCSEGEWISESLWGMWILPWDILHLRCYYVMHAPIALSSVSQGNHEGREGATIPDNKHTNQLKYSTCTLPWLNHGSTWLYLTLPWLYFALSYYTIILVFCGYTSSIWLETVWMHLHVHVFGGRELSKLCMGTRLCICAGLLLHVSNSKSCNMPYKHCHPCWCYIQLSN